MKKDVAGSGVKSVTTESLAGDVNNGEVATFYKSKSKIVRASSHSITKQFSYSYKQLPLILSL